MDRLSYGEFVNLFGGLWALKKGRVPEEGTDGRVGFDAVAIGYFEQLKHLPGDLLRGAIATAYNHERMATPAQIREAANQVIRQRQDEEATQKRLAEAQLAALPPADNPVAGFVEGVALRGDDRPLLTLEELAAVKAWDKASGKPSPFAPIATENGRRYDARENVGRFVRSLAYWTKRKVSYAELGQSPVAAPSGGDRPAQVETYAADVDVPSTAPPAPANPASGSGQGGDLEFLPFDAGDAVVVTTETEGGPTVGEIGYVQACRQEGGEFVIFAVFGDEPCVLPETAVEFADFEEAF